MRFLCPFASGRASGFVDPTGEIKRMVQHGGMTAATLGPVRRSGENDGPGLMFLSILRLRALSTRRVAQFKTSLLKKCKGLAV